MGEFNIHADEFTSSEWPELLKAQVVTPRDTETTISTADNNIIDFVLVSNCIAILCYLFL